MLTCTEIDQSSKERVKRDIKDTSKRGRRGAIVSAGIFALVLPLLIATPASAATYNFGYFNCADGYRTYTWANAHGTVTHQINDNAGSFTGYTYHGSSASSRTYYWHAKITIWAKVTGSINAANRACYAG